MFVHDIQKTCLFSEIRKVMQKVLRVLKTIRVSDLKDKFQFQFQLNQLKWKLPLIHTASSTSDIFLFFLTPPLIRRDHYLMAIIRVHDPTSLFVLLEFCLLLFVFVYVWTVIYVCRYRVLAYIGRSISPLAQYPIKEYPSKSLFLRDTLSSDTFTQFSHQVSHNSSLPLISYICGVFDILIFICFTQMMYRVWSKTCAPPP